MTENPYSPPAADLEQPLEPGTVELASRGKRLLAAFVDGIIMMAVFIPIWMLGGIWQDITNGIQPSIGQMLSLSGLGLIGFLTINGFTLATRGQTLGKMLLKIQIVDQQSAQILGLGKLVGLRMLPLWVVSLIPMLGNIASLVDVLFIFGKQRRCVHDMIAGTKVIDYVPA